MSCEGSGCDQCDQRGWTPITCCPLTLVPGDVWELVTHASDAEAGYLPVAGGTLDQTQSFLDGWRRLRAEKAYWRANLKTEADDHG